MPSFVITQPSWFSSKLELQENGRVLGELNMLKKMSYALAEAKMPEGNALFGYKGWTGRTLFIQDAEGRDIATAKSLSWWSYNVMVTIDGVDYEWKMTNWWNTYWGWYGPDGRSIMEMRMRWSGKVDVTSPRQLNKTEMLLLFFAMYILRLQAMDGSAAGGVYA